jgi:hypothetical protein
MCMYVCWMQAVETVAKLVKFVYHTTTNKVGIINKLSTIAYTGV